jgi:stearoyl-CoA desaturase (delta-9 desaturase)
MVFEKAKINWGNSLPILLVHLAPLLVFVTGVHWYDWVVLVVLYFVRMFFLTGGYHRYFSHRSFQVGRLTQFILAFGGATAAQRGPLWWAGVHRRHHAESDTFADTHSPIRGFWWSHMVWFMSATFHEVDHERIRDLEKYPELRWLDRFWVVPPTMLAVGCWVFGGASTLIIGFFLSTVILYHGVFAVNSLSHLVGWRRFATADASRNSFILALFTGGEGFHNNHHHLQSSARQGFYWWEIDTTYYVLKVLQWCRVVKKMMEPTRAQLVYRRLKKGVQDKGLEAFYEARRKWRILCREKKIASSASVSSQLQ